MFLADAHPSIQRWSSESIRISYEVPEIRNGVLVKRMTIYIPDFFVIYVNKNLVQHKEVIEVKPKDEMPGYGGRVSKLKEARQAMNLLKWQAAMRFCAARNWRFRVATQDELFAFNRKSL
jgi:hypothetical protein